MPIDPTRLCKCHGKPMFRQRNDGRIRCTVRRREGTRRYQQTAKGRTAKQRASQTHNQRRIWIGKNYHSEAATVEQARTIRAHIRRRLGELVTRQQSRAEMESGTSG